MVAAKVMFIWVTELKKGMDCFNVAASRGYTVGGYLRNYVLSFVGV